MRAPAVAVAASLAALLLSPAPASAGDTGDALRRIAESFDACDADKDGRVDPKELPLGEFFAQVDAKTEDDFFLGWPSYWNVVALYAWVLELGPAAASAWVVLLSALVFVPLKYIYPSKLRRFRAATALGGFVWVWVMAFIVWFPERMARVHAPEVSLSYLVWYVGLSAWLGAWWRPRSRRSA